MATFGKWIRCAALTNVYSLTVALLLVAGVRLYFFSFMCACGATKSEAPAKL